MMDLQEPIFRLPLRPEVTVNISIIVFQSQKSSVEMRKQYGYVYTRM